MKTDGIINVPLEKKKRKWGVSSVFIIGSILCFVTALVITVIDVIDYIKYMINPHFFNWPISMWLEDDWYFLVPAVVFLALGLIVRKIPKKERKYSVRSKKRYEKKDVQKIIKRVCIIVLCIGVVSFAGYKGYRLYDKIRTEKSIKEHNDQLYDEAMDLIGLEQYSEARRLLWNVTDRDVSEDIGYCNYCLAKQSHENGMLDDAYKIFVNMTDYKDVAEILAGEEYDRVKLRYQWTTYKGTVKFGQNEWIILRSSNENSALLLSKEALYTTTFEKTDEKDSQLLWKNSSVRSYLNSYSFLNTYFSAEEQKCIIPTTISTLDEAENASEYVTDQTYETTDKVFILSSEEASSWGGKGLVRSTSYYKNGSEITRTLYTANGRGVVRTARYEESYNTSYRGFPDDLFNVTYTKFEIYPAMWVDYEKVIDLELGIE